MSKPLCVNLDPIVVLALLQKMGVQSSDIDDVTERRNYLMIHAWTLAFCKQTAGVCGQFRSQLIRRNLRVGLLNNGVECRLLVSFGEWARILVHIILAYSSDLGAVCDISSLLFRQQTCSLCWLALKIYFQYFRFLFQLHAQLTALVVSSRQFKQQAVIVCTALRTKSIARLKFTKNDVHESNEFSDKNKLVSLARRRGEFI